MSVSSTISLDQLKSVYFVGIGGIGMSAIARYFKSIGINVSGYDKTETSLTRQLQNEGIDVNYSDSAEAVPRNVDLVVFTPAIPRDHKGLEYYRANGYKVVKRSDVLQAVSENTFNICVAGTHGKTTISTMIAHVLRDSGYGANAFLGGIAVNYNTNFWASEKNVAVIEADEYDRSFHKLSPDIAVISSMDADHLDIYGDEKSMQDAFVEFGEKIRNGGLLIHKFGLKRVSDIKVERRYSYSLQNDAADIYASSIRIDQGGYVFNAHLPGKVIQDIRINIGGMHNVENQLVAIAVAAELDIDDDKIRSAIASFKGVRRRFEYIIPPVKQKEGGYVQPVLIDDYAHHPEELRALLKSTRALFPERILTVVFQPHLFTRTRDHAEGFAEVLQLADKIRVLPIYPARELPIEGVSSEIITEKIKKSDTKVIEKQDLVDHFRKESVNKEFGEVIVMAGAGDIDVLVEPVKNYLEKES